MLQRKITVILLMITSLSSYAQEMQDMWTKEANAVETHPNIKWFKDAKFGMFIHWGLYSKLGGVWDDSTYYGSGEWIMKRGKIPADEYAEIAEDFNPTEFDAEEWIKVAKDAGMRYMVITAKHHEGFALFDSKVSNFDIMDASPYGKDPLKALSKAAAKADIKFGFYYSQFQDWHEPNGGRNNWDFNEKEKDYQKYYREKAIPQLKELLTNYGPLGIIWFDTPGGLSKEKTLKMIAELRALQPSALFSSRVGHGLGDYKDFGDSEVPPVPIGGAWESLYTHNDSWGYIARDKNFKTPKTIIHLLANIASKGGNLLLNVGPDGEGRMPALSVKYLKEVGNWLDKNGESIYGSTHGLIPAQPWGVTTGKPGKIYLHILQKPSNGRLFVPGVTASVKSIGLLDGGTILNWKKENGGLVIDLPNVLPDERNTVVVLEYNGQQTDHSADRTQTLSRAYAQTEIFSTSAEHMGGSENKLFTYSHYFGDWKHENLSINLKKQDDKLLFNLNVLQPGEYKVILDYACETGTAGREGVLKIDGEEQLFFRSLGTGEYDSHRPMMFIQHSIGLINIPEAGKHQLSINPIGEGSKGLFRLRKVLMQPVE